MSADSAAANQYLHGNLLNAIEDSISKLGKTIETITSDELSAVDEFHIGGRRATENILGQFRISKQDHIIDVGCGLGGASRYVAKKYSNKVTGIDLTQEYVETGNVMCSWLNLDSQIKLVHGSALSMPFEEGTFDSGYMLHVGMNIEDKPQLFTEIFRVLRPGSTFGIYDVMRCNEGDLIYPVPWAAEQSSCYLSTVAQYKQALGDAGFMVKSENNRRDFAIEFFEKLRIKMQENGGPPPLGLHTLMKESTEEKINNMIANISANYIAPIELIIKKF